MEAQTKRLKKRGRMFLLFFSLLEHTLISALSLHVSPATHLQTAAHLVRYKILDYTQNRGDVYRQTSLWNLNRGSVVSRVLPLENGD